MRSPLPFRVIPCDEWGAAPPRGTIAKTDRPRRGLFHHTAGHHRELDGKLGTVTYEESCAYARAIQSFHMGKSRGWNDSGHNFLVTRGGYILEGRHGSLAACRAGLMVVSAHCPGQNDQPGVEHEHMNEPAMPAIQFQASAWLYANLCRWAAFKPTEIYPHRKFFATSCPGTLTDDLPRLRLAVEHELHPLTDTGAWWDKYGPTDKPHWFFEALAEYQRRLAE